MHNDVCIRRHIRLRKEVERQVYSMNHKFMEEDILFEDEQILVVRKHAGIAVQHVGAGAMDLEHLLLNYLAGKGVRTRRIPYLAVIHRLDQPVEGILVFAKTQEAARELNRQLQRKEMKKEYVAVVEHAREEGSGKLVDYLWKDGKQNLSRVAVKGMPGAKQSELDYWVRKKDGESGRALVEILLKTGRHHQIRVQMAHAGMPLCGDRKYNPECIKGEELALCAVRLSFRHPANAEKLEFEITPENPLFHDFAREGE